MLPSVAQVRHPKTYLYFLLVLVLIGVAAVFRFTSLRKNGMLYDEQFTQAIRQQIWNGNLSNYWKNAPGMPEPFRIESYNFSSYMYADALAVSRHASRPLYRDRNFSAVLGTLAVILFYVAAIRLFDARVAFAALALLAVFPLLVQDAHYARPEAFVTCLSAIVYLCSAMLLSSRRLISWLTAASICCGLLVACKISMAPMAALPLCALVARRTLTIRATAVWILFLTAGFAVGVPSAFAHPQIFWKGIEFLRHQYANDDPPYSLLDSAHCYRLLLPYFWQTLGPLCCIFSVAGAVVLVLEKQYSRFALIAVPPLFYVLYFGSQRVFFERNLSHVAGPIAILAGVGIVRFAEILPVKYRKLGYPLFLIASIIIAAQVSYKLVYIAMQVTPRERARSYEEQLSRREGLPVGEVMEFVVPGHVEEALAAVEGSASDAIITIRDYHDGYTRRERRELQNRIRTRDVGFFPSLFPNFTPDTILTYHSPNLRYIRLFAPDTAVRAGQTFVSWKRVRGKLPPRTVTAGSWVRNGVHPSAYVPDKDEFFGSYTPAGGDSNRGTLSIGPFEVRDPISIGIPLMTGPDQRGLSISVVNDRTGDSVARLNPTHTPHWAIWRVSVSPDAADRVRVVAQDNGPDWGQWLAIGYPLSVQ